VRTYKIGTRGSLLAVTQTKIMQRELERLTGDRFDIITIKTQGDLNTSAPLWQLEGKDFFTKELDEALLKGEIDLVIHSYKDLGSVRPAGIKLAAVTQRRFANDILLIKEETISKLKDKSELIVGTSSPRRIVNVEKNLHHYLPHFKNKPIKTKMLRGNVNTRIKKLQDNEFDAIILAMAGLERLTTSENSLSELTQLIQGLNFFIMPQSIFPSSASQGALGIECLEERNDQNELLNKIALLNHDTTIEEVKRERKAFNEYGGGCHLAVGINVKKIHDFYVHYHRGQVDNQEINLKFIEPKQAFPLNVTSVFLGMNKNSSEKIVYDEVILKKPLQQTVNAKHLLITSSHCLAQLQNTTGIQFLWASGTRTLEKTVEQGFWVNGTLDGQGEEILENYLNSDLIKLIFVQKQVNPSEIKVLTNDKTTNKLGETIPCYERQTANPSDSFKKRLLNCQAYFWTSNFQYETYVKLFPELTQNDKFHACGLGKTYIELKEKNVNITPFIDAKHFLNSFNI
jgi:hydroxymethylbilane synthase